jgi:hypothetical protein
VLAKNDHPFQSQPADLIDQLSWGLRLVSRSASEQLLDLVNQEWQVRPGE